jgi:hypothetical protein
VSERNHLKAEYGLRLFLVLITFALAAAVPRLDLFISLVGYLLWIRIRIRIGFNGVPGSG